MFGPIALVYNLPGIQTLVVNSDVLAKIFSGGITKWNDPILAALNPGVALPDTQDHADLPDGFFGNHRQPAADI